MNFEQLTAFIAVAESCSIRKAGEHTFMSPQNVSRLILQFEKECCVNLFERTPTGMQLTTQGKEAYPMIKKILNDLDEFKASFGIKDSHVLASPLRPIAIYSTYTAHRIASNILNDYYALEQDTEISYYVYTASTINERLSNGFSKKLPVDQQIIDIAITKCGNEDLDVFLENVSRNYVVYCLFDDCLALEVPSLHPYAQLKYISKELLENNTIYVLSDGPEDKTYAEILLERHGINMKKINRFSDPNFVRRFASVNGRFVIVPYPSSTYYSVPDVTIIPIEGNIMIKNLLLINKNCISQRLTQFIINAFKDKYPVERLN